MNNIILALLIGLTKSLSLLPRSIFENKNSSIWKVLSRRMQKRKKIITANIYHCYPDKDINWKDELIEKIWDDTFLALYENNFAWNATKKQIVEYHCEYQNAEILSKAQSEKKGVLLLFRHSVFLELSARLISEKFLIYGMERPNNSAAIQALQQRGRLKGMQGLTSKSNVQELIEWIKEGKTVLYGPDQDYQNKRSIVSSFFGKRCLTTTVPFTLKKITGCKLIYLDFYKTNIGYKFELSDISNIAESKEEFAEKINRLIEESVNRAPEHYLWHHRRFKSQAPEIYD